ncbi:hemin importer ATP-binding subunit [Pseudomonas sp. StFLB209]|uniref:heme ABC transporter ATP-binding protein n=1 Tax=Pseudomonas sp. StFLB209 TaxID=1028989 RepID=UPI0004F79676|nr:heme ABC transporter ATP-binding protein [Pseudomonas sp. StFLB209]BAP41671.1 hemin importer ATP-binding subunit [Pseudomonas sp. StFLB209]
MLRAENLHIVRGERSVLSGVDLQLQAGQVLGVLGPNGAGKSSLLAALSGDLKPAQGRVWLADKPLQQWAAEERARRLAVLPQSSTLSFAFRVDEVVGMGRLPHATGAEQDARIVQAALQAADALHLAERGYMALSGGERQRVHLARVLAQLWPGDGDCVLLLDEPTSMLDPLHQHTVLQAVRRFAERSVAVLIVLHDLNLAARYCDRLLLINEGCVHLAGTAFEVLQPAALKHVFGLDVLVQAHPELGHPLVIAR